MIERTFFVYTHSRPDTNEVFYVGKGTRTRLKQYIRATTTVRRNIYWRRIVKKAGWFNVKIFADFFDECDAFAYERELIALYGRRVDGGTLCNLTSGGEGHAGLSPSAETRLKMSKSNRGIPKSEYVKQAVSLAQRGVPNPPEQNLAHSIRMSGPSNPNFGKKNSPETIAKRVATRGNKCSGESHPFYGKKRPQHVIDVLREKQSRAVIDNATGTIYPTVQDAATAFGKASSTISRWLHGHRRNPTSLEFA
ncbi:MAG: NUMOD3 domain-containing DNA-binding protein [Gammaproteobacteria bacterium]